MDKFILIESDPQEILNDAFKFHEELTGVKLPIAHKTTFIYSTTSALIANIKAEMNEVAIQNYLEYARSRRLDLKGTFYGSRGERLLPNNSRTTIRCFVSISAPRDVIIAKGTRFLFKKYLFYTEKENVIKKGSLYTDVIAVCDVPGNIGEILPGEIKEIVDRYDFYQSIENISEVTGGRDTEEDEPYRGRLKLAPESFTSAGSEGAYKFHTKQASSLVTDVVVDTPTPNVLNIYVINNNELLSEEEKNKIKDFLYQEDIKALNDVIYIKDPNIHNFEIDFDYWIYDKTPYAISIIEENMKNKLRTWADSKKIGESINLQDIIEICKSVKGVKRININKPLEYIAEPFTIAICKTDISCTFKGSESV